MRPTDPRELLHPVLTPDTYRRLGITPPRPPQQYGTGGPVSSAGTPYLTGRAITGTAVPTGSRTVTPDPLPPPPVYVPTAPPRKDRTVWIVAIATAIIIAIIAGATWIVLASRGPDDEQRIRDVIAAETAAINNRDLASLTTVRCTVDVIRLRRQYTSQTFAAEIDSMLGPAGRWKVTVDAVRIDAGAGTAEADQTSVPVGAASSIPQVVTDTSTLRKESGGWKVCVSSATLS